MLYEQATHLPATDYKPLHKDTHTQTYDWTRTPTCGQTYDNERLHTKKKVMKKKKTTQKQNRPTYIHTWNLQLQNKTKKIQPIIKKKHS